MARAGRGVAGGEGGIRHSALSRHLPLSLPSQHVAIIISSYCRSTRWFLRSRGFPSAPAAGGSSPAGLDGRLRKNRLWQEAVWQREPRPAPPRC